MKDFEAFLDRLAARLEPLGTPAPAAGGTIHAAVALLLRPSSLPAGVAEILFIKRAERDGDPWSGHIALPGGRSEEDDESLVAVALRETSEEVGIDIGSGGRVLGRLPTVEPLSVHLPPIDVTPFVARAPDGAAVRPQAGEVEDAFWLPVGELHRTGASVVVRRMIRGEQREWPAYPSPAGAIWGITHRIITTFLALLD